MKKVLGVIPARYGSSRFEGKPLHVMAGKPMIQWVYEQASKSQYLTDVIVATDDIRIFQAVEAFGGKAMMTSSEHPSGTDRIAEVAASQSDMELVVNIQGDEPLISPKMIDRTIEPLLFNSGIHVSTPVVGITEKEDMINPNVVKAVRDNGGFALYFSRSPIPFDRDGSGALGFKHIGLYVYQRDFLLKFTRFEPTELENIEKLEQLRVLENGYRILTVTTSYQSIGVDTIEDARRVEEILLKEER